jgi:hypothetical protein
VRLAETKNSVLLVTSLAYTFILNIFVGLEVKRRSTGAEINMSAK